MSKIAFVAESFTSNAHKCLTVTQCKNYGSYYHPYSAFGLCMDAKPDSSVSEKEDGYKCETGYLYIYRSNGYSYSKCVSREDCIKDGAIVYDENKTCIKGHNCIKFNGYFY